MPSPHLLVVNSSPMQGDDRSWEEWHTKHFLDMLMSGAADRAALYRETYDVPSLYAGNKHKIHPRKYLAIYQAGSPEPLKSKEYAQVGEKFPVKDEDSADGNISANNFELVDDFNPDNLEDNAPPYLLYAGLDFEDGKELHDFYRQEHFPLLAKVKGYRRGLRFKLGQPSSLSLETPTRFLALHECDADHGLNGTKEMEAVTQTPWTFEVMSKVKFAEIRTFELVKAIGY